MAAGQGIHFDLLACTILDALERRDHIMRRDGRTAAAENLRSVGIGTNDRDGFDFLQRQGAIILEQHDRFARRLADDLAMLRLILTAFGIQFRLAKQTCFIQHAQQTADLVIETFFGQWTIIERALDHLFGHPACFAGHFKIEPARGDILIVGAEPIRHNDAIVLPFALEDLNQGVMIFRSIRAVDAVVRRHHCPRFRFADRQTERFQINFTQGAFIHFGAH